MAARGREERGGQVAWGLWTLRLPGGAPHLASGLASGLTILSRTAAFFASSWALRRAACARARSMVHLERKVMVLRRWLMASRSKRSPSSVTALPAAAVRLALPLRESALRLCASALSRMVLAAPRSFAAASFFALAVLRRSLCWAGWRVLFVAFASLISVSAFSWRASPLSLRAMPFFCNPVYASICVSLSSVSTAAWPSSDCDASRCMRARFSNPSSVSCRCLAIWQVRLAFSASAKPLESSLSAFAFSFFARLISCRI
mmetsp:Transcript_11704/g.27588  ORF Transcript_11704/g.27588 Transcript_11704/m.27588 type:complete len:261 (+) Transcript_11704:57-839(+)